MKYFVIGALLFLSTLTDVKAESPSCGLRSSNIGDLYSCTEKVDRSAKKEVVKTPPLPPAPEPPRTEFEKAFDELAVFYYKYKDMSYEEFSNLPKNVQESFQLQEGGNRKIHFECMKNFIRERISYIFTKEHIRDAKTLDAGAQCHRQQMYKYPPPPYSRFKRLYDEKYPEAVNTMKSAEEINKRRCPSSDGIFDIFGKAELSPQKVCNRAACLRDPAAISLCEDIGGPFN